MKAYLTLALMMIGISLFCGIVVISIGIGSLFPQLNQVAAPIVCGSGSMQVKQHVNSYRPGETSWSISAYCIDDQTGVKTDVTGWVQLVAGLIYSLIPFVILVILYFVSRFRNDKTPEVDAPRPEMISTPNLKFKDSRGLEEKLEKLKELREANLITEEDYQKKKDKLLDNL